MTTCTSRASPGLLLHVNRYLSVVSVRPIDVQAGLGLQRCMDALQTMNVSLLLDLLHAVFLSLHTLQTIWPSAGRAWELLHGAKIDMRDVELSRQAQRRLNKQDKRKRTPEGTNDNVVNLSEPRHGQSTVLDGNVSAPPLPSVEFGKTEMQPAMPPLEPQPQPRLQFSQPQQYSLRVDVSNSPVNSFSDFDRWPTQEGFNYPSGLSGMTQFADTGSSDSPKDLWKDFSEQFADPSLITSSLYGLPVISGPLQGQAPPFMGDFSSMYNSQSFFD